MSLRKRWRVLMAAVFQQWHINQCGECGAQWWAIGPAHPELIRICDDCELTALNAMFAHAEREYQRQTRGAR